MKIYKILSPGLARSSSKISRKTVSHCPQGNFLYLRFIAHLLSSSFKEAVLLCRQASENYQVKLKWSNCTWLASHSRLGSMRWKLTINLLTIPKIDQVFGYVNVPEGLNLELLCTTKW